MKTSTRWLLLFPTLVTTACASGIDEPPSAPPEQVTTRAYENGDLEAISSDGLVRLYWSNARRFLELERDGTSTMVAIEQIPTLTMLRVLVLAEIHAPPQVEDEQPGEAEAYSCSWSTYSDVGCVCFTELCDSGGSVTYEAWCYGSCR